MTQRAAKTDVWLADLDACAVAFADCERATPRLSPDDLARACAVADPLMQARRVNAAISLRLVLERRFGPGLRGVPLPRERLGRPVLPDGFVGAFSLSHCGGLALIGVTTADRIGVDLEMLRPVRMAERRRVVIEAAAETVLLDGLPIDPVARFLQAWVVLEALAKADGRGIGHLLTQLGAVGGRNGHDEAAAMMARELAVNVAVLDVGGGCFAGIAGSAVAPVVLPFPDIAAGIADLIGG